MAEENIDDDFEYDGIDTLNTDESSDFPLNSHDRVRTYLCGTIIELKDNYSRVSLATNADMTTDEDGLVHSGFIFSAADHAAHVAINKAYTVLIAANVKFFAPLKVGDIAIFEAQAKFEDSRKREVLVRGTLNEIKIFEGTFITVTLDEHALKRKASYRKKRTPSKPAE